MIFLVHKLLFLNHSSANQCVFALALSTVCPFVWLSVQLSDRLCVCLLSWLPVPLCTSSFVFVCMPTITLAALICLPACLPLCLACNCMCTRQISINFMLIICRFMILAYGPKKKKKRFFFREINFVETLSLLPESGNCSFVCQFYCWQKSQDEVALSIFACPFI